MVLLKLVPRTAEQCRFVKLLSIPAFPRSRESLLSEIKRTVVPLAFVLLLIHWVTGKDLPNNACDTIPAHRFVGPAAVIDVTADVERNQDFLLMPDHVAAWEARHGRIPPASWVLLRTGWSYRRDPKEFLNVRQDGPHTPGFHKSTSEFLAKERGVLGVGVETVGTDAGQAGTFDPPFPNHTIMHGAGKFGLTSLCNLDRLPPTGAVVIAAPLRIVDGSGSPVRVLALVPA